MKKQKIKPPYHLICGLGASVGCERISEHLTRRDESHKYALFFSVSTFIVVEQSDKKLYTSYLFYKYNK